jgi:hypothetical protein
MENERKREREEARRTIDVLADDGLLIFQASVPFTNAADTDYLDWAIQSLVFAACRDPHLAPRLAPLLNAATTQRGGNHHLQAAHLRAQQTFATAHLPTPPINYVNAFP